jgi:hypothetical protein
MRNKRRRIFYIDRIFQKKLLLLFLGINLGVVGANIVFYFSYLKDEVERNLYRSHIEISNINEIMAGDVVRFNILLAVVSLLLVVVFYTIKRLRLKSFFESIKEALDARREKKAAETFSPRIPERFQEIDRVLGDFFQYTDKQAEEENRRIDTLARETR